MIKEQRKYDIIIPVYNGFDFVKDCYESLLVHTDLDKHRIIIVNDCSSERELLQYFSVIKENKNTIILNNEENLGFVGSVNKGMGYSNNDVILLNSDTIVTAKWIEKMDECAYSNPNIGTVTPLSNNATLCSVPNQWEDNELPQGFSIDDFAQFIENISLRKYTEIPSPVGFCMLIKRETISGFGLFDAEAFGKGYGEENDFGMRIYRGGYYHVVDDSTFIFHKGSMTFNKNPKKQELMERNRKILFDRYPELDNLLKDFEANKPMADIYENIKLRMKYYSNDIKRILFTNVMELDKLPSGALKHVLDLVLDLGDQFICFNMFLRNRSIFIEQYESGEITGKFEFPLIQPFNPLLLHHSEIEKTFEHILRMFNISVVHFQTPQELPLSLIKVAKSMSRIVYFTAHDYLLYCNIFTLMKNVGDYEQFCDFEENPSVCYQCMGNMFPSNPSLHGNYNIERRNYIKTILPFIDKIIFPSNIHKQKIKEIFVMDDEKLKVIPHGIKLQGESKTISIDKDVKQTKLKIAYIGNFMEVKGSKEFARLVDYFKYDDQIEWYIIGKIADQETYGKLLGYEKVQFVGEYNYHELNSILENKGINLILLLSKCAESFGFTLSEAHKNNIPVIVSDLGALEERIRENGGGWIVNNKSMVDEATEIIKNILSDKQILKEKRNEISLPIDYDNYISEYRELYHCQVSSLEPLQGFELSYFYWHRNSQQLMDNKKAPNVHLVEQSVYFKFKGKMKKYIKKMIGR